MFLGNYFAASANTVITQPSTTTLTSLVIGNAIFKEIFITNDLLDFDGEIPDEWDFNTRFHAYFKGDLYAGNVEFTEEVITGIKIKKKTPKDTSWQVIYEKDVNDSSDFAVELLDYLEPVGTITYAYVPMISNVESDYITASVESSFDAYFIVEKDVSYPLNVDISTSQTKNYGATYVKPIGRQYPIAVMNGLSGYKSGEVTATFMLADTIDTETGLNIRDYRENVSDFLTDGDPKIFKSFDGDLYMVHVTGDISDSSRQVVYNSTGMLSLVTAKFEWVETGNAYDDAELAYNGFTDVESL